MLKYSAIALAVLLVFGLIFVLGPERGGKRDPAQVQLEGVNFRLYPAQDADAEWRFRADRITFDPVSGDTSIDRPVTGERFVRGKLDMTLDTARLTIDDGDNLRMRQATAHILDSCATLLLRGSDAKPVVIDQNAGYVSPYIRLDIPEGYMTFSDITMSFNLDVRGTTQPNAINLDAPKTCKNGKVVAVKRVN